MAVPSFLKSMDYFFVLRPMLFIPGWSTLLAGYLITSKQQIFFTPSQFSQLNILNVIFLLVIFSMAMGASFLLNQIMDVDTDLKNKKLFILSENHISKKSALIETIFLIILSVILSLKLGFVVLMTVIVFIILTGYMYNYKPFVLKNKPLGSVIANAVMGWLAFATGWLAVNGFNSGLIADSMPYLLFNTALYFFTLLPDVPGDKKCNKKTVAVLFGTHTTIYTALSFYSLSFVTALVLKDYFAFIIILFSLPFFIVVAFKKDISSTIKATKYAIFFFAIAICLKIPYYFLLLVTIFIFTKWYFVKRFKYNYPNFKGE